jgi:hypothetical protein
MIGGGNWAVVVAGGAIKIPNTYHAFMYASALWSCVLPGCV